MSDMYEGRELDWEDTINQDDEYILLEPGVYEYTVRKLERSRTTGNGSLPPCNMMIVTVGVDSPQGEVPMQSRLVLHSRLEWKISQFFVSIGLKKRGEPLVMDWKRVIGCKGKLRLKHRTYNDREYNDIERFLPKEAPAYTPGVF